MTDRRHALGGVPAPDGGLGDAAAVHARTGRAVPDATVARLATIFRVLGGFRDGLAVTVSSDELAAAAGVNSAMLRKDLSYLGSYGIRGVGYDVITLTEETARVLGLTVHRSVALIGVGNLGQALAGYSGFASRGYSFARRPLRRRSGAHGCRDWPLLVVQDVAHLHGVVPQEERHHRIMAIPAAADGEVCAGSSTPASPNILNFAPVRVERARPPGNPGRSIWPPSCRFSPSTRIARPPKCPSSGGWSAM